MRGSEGHWKVTGPARHKTCEARGSPYRRTVAGRRLLRPDGAAVVVGVLPLQVLRRCLDQVPLVRLRVCVGRAAGGQLAQDAGLGSQAGCTPQREQRHCSGHLTWPVEWPGPAGKADANPAMTGAPHCPPLMKPLQSGSVTASTSSCGDTLHDLVGYTATGS